MDATSLRKISDWIIDGARSAATPSQMMAECSERLVQAGLPLWRVGVFVRTLHPEIIGWSFIWKPGEEVQVGSVDFNFRATPEFRFSPLTVVFRDGVEVRADPRGPDSERFPILVDLRAEGVTDYLALPMMFMDRGASFLPASKNQHNRRLTHRSKHHLYSITTSASLRIGSSNARS